MTRFSLFLAFILTCSGIYAESVSREAARYTAQSYLMAKGKRLSSTTKHFAAPRKSAVKADEAYYYVFNAGEDNGYVIVSGDDRTEPILGYVEQGTFDIDNIPENMRSWLQLYEDQIRFIVDNDLQPSSPQLRPRNKVRGTKRSVPELMTSRWNQGYPYNLTCPKYYKGDGTQDYPATGCTATAMAQVINFYKFPEKTKMAIPAITNTYTLDNGTKKTVTTKTIPRGSKIDWENMRDTYNCNDSHTHNAQDTAVANLMYYCGQAVHMGYGASSGANFDTNTFVNYLGFDDGCYIGERGDYSIDQWFDMLYKDIAEGYPVLFSGFSSGGGHAFVLDGFDGEDLFHVNWGWGGGSNGWFLVGILNPGDNSGIGASSSSDGYSMGQRALFNLRLPDNIKADPRTALTINDVQISGTSIKGNWVNWTGTVSSFNTGIVVQNEDGTLTPVGATQTITSMSVNTYASKTFSILKKLPEGTYKLSPASKLTTAKTWRPKYNMRDEYIRAVVDANGTPTLTLVTPVEDICIEKIEFPGTRIVNTEQEVKVTFRNNGDEYFREVMFFASKTNDMVYTESRSMVAVRKGETVEVSYFFKPAETGTYNLTFSTNTTQSGKVGEGTMEIVTAAQAKKANLSVTSFTILNVTSGVVYGNQLTGKISVRNNAKEDFHGQVRIQLWKMWDGENVAWSDASHSYSVDIMAGKVASVEFEFTGLNTGCKYYMPVYYVGQEGELTGAGLWDHNWRCNRGVLNWSTKGVITGKARTSSMATTSTVCGIYADCDKITRMTPNKNPNTIYAFHADMEVPANLLASTSNWVSGNHADHLNLQNDNPLYVPASFEADSASFTYTFPETEKGTGWHTFTMPFEADSIFVDSIPVNLNDSLSHFWIYEFAEQGENGEVIFQPATILRGATPYIIAADSTMAGRSVVFRSLDVPMFKTGSDKMVVTSDDYRFHGTTLAPSVKDCYVLNNEGTAFEYITTAKVLTGLNTYFTVRNDDFVFPEALQLPDVPKAPSTAVEGDANGDGTVTIQDVVNILEMMASDSYSPAADVNHDGAITIQDVVKVLEIMASL